MNYCGEFQACLSYLCHNSDNLLIMSVGDHHNSSLNLIQKVKIIFIGGPSSKRPSFELIKLSYSVAVSVCQESHPLLDVMKYAMLMFCLIHGFVNIRCLPGALATGKFMSFFMLLIVLHCITSCSVLF